MQGKVVVLAASACETSRLMLNSKSQRHPNGLSNSSNVVGKYLHDSTGAGMGGYIPNLFGRKRYNEDGVGGMHVYSPWWLDNKKLDFPRGYHIEYGGGFGMPLYGFQWGIENLNGTYKVKGKQKEAVSDCPACDLWVMPCFFAKAFPRSAVRAKTPITSASGTKRWYDSM